MEFKDWDAGPSCSPGSSPSFLPGRGNGHGGRSPRVRACAGGRDYNRLRARWGGADAIDARLHLEAMRDGARRLHDTTLDDPRWARSSCTSTTLAGARRPSPAVDPAGYDRTMARPVGRGAVDHAPSLVEVLGHGWDPLVPLLHPTGDLVVLEYDPLIPRRRGGCTRDGGPRPEGHPGIAVRDSSAWSATACRSVGGRHDGREAMLKDVWAPVSQHLHIRLDVERYLAPATRSWWLATTADAASGGEEFAGPLRPCFSLWDPTASSLEQITDTGSWA